MAPARPIPINAQARQALETRERVLDAAEVLFSVRGLAGTSMRDIARAAGLQVASLYNHFEGKQALYEAVLDRGVQPLMDLVTKLGESVGPGIDADEVMGAIMAHLSRHPNLPLLIQHEALTGGENLEQLARRWIKPLIDMAVEAMHEGGSAFDRDEHPLAIAAWLQLIFGHFTMAPLLRVVLDDEPLSDEALARQTVFLQKLARLMIGDREE